MDYLGNFEMTDLNKDCRWEDGQLICKIVRKEEAVSKSSSVAQGKNSMQIQNKSLGKSLKSMVVC
jgi:hypothetical protein